MRDKYDACSCQPGQLQGVPIGKIRILVLPFRNKKAKNRQIFNDFGFDNIGLGLSVELSKYFSSFGELEVIELEKLIKKLKTSQLYGEAEEESQILNKIYSLNLHVDFYILGSFDSSGNTIKNIRLKIFDKDNQSKEIELPTLPEKLTDKYTIYEAISQSILDKVTEKKKVYHITDDTIQYVENKKADDYLVYKIKRGKGIITSKNNLDKWLVSEVTKSSKEEALKPGIIKNSKMVFKLSKNAKSYWEKQKQIKLIAFKKNYEGLLFALKSLVAELNNKLEEMEFYRKKAQQSFADSIQFDNNYFSAIYNFNKVYRKEPKKVIELRRDFSRNHINSFKNLQYEVPKLYQKRFLKAFSNIIAQKINSLPKGYVLSIEGYAQGIEEPAYIIQLNSDIEKEYPEIYQKLLPDKKKVFYKEMDFINFLKEVFGENKYQNKLQTLKEICRMKPFFIILKENTPNSMKQKIETANLFGKTYEKGEDLLSKLKEIGFKESLEIKENEYRVLQAFDVSVSRRRARYVYYLLNREKRININKMIYRGMGSILPETYPESARLVSFGISREE